MRFWTFGSNHRGELGLVRFLTFTPLNTAMLSHIILYIQIDSRDTYVYIYKERESERQRGREK